LIEIFKNQVIQHAHILMPNRYEAELLTGTKINDEKEAKDVCDLLHEKGIQIVVLKSLDFEEEYITLIGSQKNAKKYKIKVKKVKGYFTGTGDLIAALILATTTLHKY
jgi:pyridoxine kinase